MLDFLKDAAGDIVGSVLGFVGAEQTNDANLAIAHHNSAFNAEQAALARNFNRDQAAEQRAWSTEERRQQQLYNSAEAQVARQFSADMSNTSWQRGVRDMQAAGINPMLAFMKGGASTPTASGATSSIPGGATATGPAATSASNVAMLNQLQHAVSGAQGLANLAISTAQAENIAADTKLKSEQAILSRDSAMNQRTQAHLNIERIPQVRMEIAKLDEQINLIKSEQDRNRADQLLKQAQRQLTIAEETKTKNYSQGAMFQADLAIKKTQELLTKNLIPLSNAEAEAQSSPLGPIMAHIRLLLGNNAAATILRAR